MLFSFCHAWTPARCANCDPLAVLVRVERKPNLLLVIGNTQHKKLRRLDSADGEGSGITTVVIDINNGLSRLLHCLKNDEVKTRAIARGRSGKDVAEVTPIG